TNTISVSADVQNIGNFETDEIVQLYFHDRVGSITRPVKELKGFKKIRLMPGETKTVQFEIAPADLEFFNGENYVTEPGAFDVWIGPNSVDGLKGEFSYE
ncbi:MAG: fibronectin type III-like domain-contianing protein, partial [Bacteroidales bacterium]|nr:fibronectin type III-like domain-contianing protein [Bacteroidales bacterium]